MSKKNRSNILSVLARTALAFVFVLGQTAWAGQGQNAKDKPTSNAAANPRQTPPNPSTAGSKGQAAEEETTAPENSSAEETSHRGGQHEGIKVHGHWTIDVRNPDGTLASHREFENSLVQFDGGGLAVLLSRQVSVGAWYVVIVDFTSPTADLCHGAFGGNVVGGLCYIGENTPAFAAQVGSANTDSSNLVVGTSGQNANTTGPVILNLSGSVTVPTAGAISGVQSNFLTCPATVSPSACLTTITDNLFSNEAFTRASLSTPVSVAAGQTVAVTVVITFS